MLFVAGWLKRPTPLKALPTAEKQPIAGVTGEDKSRDTLCDVTAKPVHSTAALPLLVRLQPLLNCFVQRNYTHFFNFAYCRPSRNVQRDVHTGWEEEIYTDVGRVVKSPLVVNWLFARLMVRVMVKRHPSFLSRPAN